MPQRLAAVCGIPAGRGGACCQRWHHGAGTARGCIPQRHVHISAPHPAQHACTHCSPQGGRSEEARHASGGPQEQVRRSCRWCLATHAPDAGEAARAAAASSRGAPAPACRADRCHGRCAAQQGSSAHAGQAQRCRRQGLQAQGSHGCTGICRPVCESQGQDGGAPAAAAGQGALPSQGWLQKGSMACNAAP